MPIDLLLRTLGLHEIVLLPDRKKKAATLCKQICSFDNCGWEAENSKWSKLSSVNSYLWSLQHSINSGSVNWTLSTLHLRQQKQPQPGTSMEIVEIKGCLADVFNCLGRWPTSVAEGSASLKGKHTGHERFCALPLTCPRGTFIIKQLQKGTKDTGAARQILLGGKINKHEPRSDLSVVMWVTIACGSSYSFHFKAPSVPS